jgi:hypothetical protein
MLTEREREPNNRAQQAEDCGSFTKHNGGSTAVSFAKVFWGVKLGTLGAHGSFFQSPLVVFMLQQSAPTARPGDRQALRSAGRRQLSNPAL